MVEYRVEGAAVVAAELIATENMVPAGSAQPLDSISVADAAEDGRHLIAGYTAAQQHFLLQEVDVLLATGEPTIVPGSDWVITFFAPLGSVNSRGDSAFIASVSAFPWHVLVKDGRLLHGQLDTFPAISPCLSEPIGRFRSQRMSTGPGGYLSATVDSAPLPLSPTQAVLAGETWRFQAWYRDLNPGPTSNFTSAVSVTF